MAAFERVRAKDDFQWVLLAQERVNDRKLGIDVISLKQAKTLYLCFSTTRQQKI
jgi:hypothetical protein